MRGGFSSGGQYELLDWLSNVTFPLEEKFIDPVFARNTYELVVKRSINCGVRLWIFIRRELDSDSSPDPRRRRPAATMGLFTLKRPKSLRTSCMRKARNMNLRTKHTYHANQRHFRPESLRRGMCFFCGRHRSGYQYLFIEIEIHSF